jgi:site-specific DNA-methyltransferase (adenine-specific)
VPQQKWNQEWTDEKLFKKYDLTREEVEYINLMIRPMSNQTDSDDD